MTTASLPAASLTTLETAPPEAALTRPAVTSRRRILCVFPRYTHSFGTFDHAFPLMGVKAFMPPQGILVIAAYMPPEWEVRLVDENCAAATRADFEWADAVFISGMHVQRQAILDIAKRAHEAGKITILGGPSVSACPELYPTIDILHIGEMGDATHQIVERLDRSVERPESQIRCETMRRLPLSHFPTPAYHLIRLRDYFLASIQFSSGCPYRCEFCDIPELYGRNPRLKTPQQVAAELDAMHAAGMPGAVYFVDDNFIGNRKAAVALLHELIAWQQRNSYPLQFACEATLNMAQAPDVLELMKEALFYTVFCGIETPEENALEAMFKKQNLRQPILEAIETLNSYGMEVVSGIIVGLDTDTPDTGERILKFIQASKIPMLTINILHALPRTPLWRRLEAEGRLLGESDRESNVEFLLPYDTVVEMWRNCVLGAYRPEAIFERFQQQMETTFRNRKKLPDGAQKITPAMLRRGIGIISRVLWQAGVRSSYRRQFWKLAWPALKKGQVEDVVHVGLVAHHLIRFAEETAAGAGEKCFYSTGSDLEARAA